MNAEITKTWFVVCTTRDTRAVEYFKGVKDGKNTWSDNPAEARLMTEDLAKSKARGLQAMKPGGMYEFDYRSK